jgi:hypothetical protein
MRRSKMPSWLGFAAFFTYFLRVKNGLEISHFCRRLRTLKVPEIVAGRGMRGMWLSNHQSTVSLAPDC